MTSPFTIPQFLNPRFPKNSIEAAFSCLILATSVFIPNLDLAKDAATVKASLPKPFLRKDSFPIMRLSITRRVSCVPDFDFAFVEAGIPDQVEVSNQCRGFFVDEHVAEFVFLVFPE